MRVLHICPTSRRDSAIAPAALDYLGHQIERRSFEQLTTVESTQLDVDVILADACFDLSLAPNIAEVLRARGIRAPVIVVLSEGGLATASARWSVTDFVLATAGPAEVEARLRVARDRSCVPASEGSTTRTAAGTVDRPLPWTAPETETLDAEDEPLVVVTGGLRIDETAFTADLGGRSLDLTFREFGLLKFFALHPERVFTRDEILLAVWGDDYFGGTRTVDVHVRRLRAKLGKDLETAIHTVRNVGYRFSAVSVTEDGHADAPREEDVKL